MRKTLGADCRVECKEVRKNNGVILHGLLVLGEADGQIQKFDIWYVFQQLFISLPADQAVTDSVPHLLKGPEKFHVYGFPQHILPADIRQLYLDTFLEAYEAGATFGSIIQRLSDICREDMLRESVDMEFFRSFGRPCLRIRLYPYSPSFCAVFNQSS